MVLLNFEAYFFCYPEYLLRQPEQVSGELLVFGFQDAHSLFERGVIAGRCLYPLHRLVGQLLLQDLVLQLELSYLRLEIVYFRLQLDDRVAGLRWLQSAEVV